MSSQNAPRDQRALQRRLAALEARLRKLETAPRTGNSSVSHGKFLVQNGEDGTELLRLGYLGEGMVGEVRGTTMARPTGELVFATWSGSGGDDGGFWALYDLAGNAIISDDEIAGQGLATPYIGAPLFAPADRSKWPSTTSSSYAPMWFGEWRKQHPRLEVHVWTQSDSGTTGDVKLLCNGASTSQAVVSADSGIKVLTVAVPGDHLSTQQVEIDLRRTGGTGFMGCWVAGAYGIQS